MKHHHRPRHLAAKTMGALAIGALALTACTTPTGTPTSNGTEAPQELTTVKTVTMSVSGTHWREIVAQAKGFFKDEGLDIEETVANPQISVDAVISGDVQIGFSDTAKSIQATEKGADLEIVASGMDKANYAFVGGIGINSIQDLKGKTIAAAGATDVYTQVIFDILKNAGVDPSEVNFTYGQNSNDRAAALQGGAIQGALIPPPADHRLEAAGLKILARTADLVPFLSLSSTVVQKSWAADHGDIIKKYIKAIAKATDWLYDPANKDEAIQILADATKSSVEDSTSAYDDYITAKAFNVGACVQSDAVKVLLEKMSGLGLLDTTDPNQFITTEYCS